MGQLYAVLRVPLVSRGLMWSREDVDADGVEGWEAVLRWYIEQEGAMFIVTDLRDEEAPIELLRVEEEQDGE